MVVVGRMWRGGGGGGGGSRRGWKAGGGGGDGAWVTGLLFRLKALGANTFASDQMVSVWGYPDSDPDTNIPPPPPAPVNLVSKALDSFFSTRSGAGNRLRGGGGGVPATLRP